MLVSTPLWAGVRCSLAVGRVDGALVFKVLGFFGTLVHGVSLGFGSFCVADAALVLTGALEGGAGNSSSFLRTVLGKRCRRSGRHRSAEKENAHEERQQCLAHCGDSYSFDALITLGSDRAGARTVPLYHERKTLKTVPADDLIYRSVPAWHD